MLDIVCMVQPRAESAGDSDRLQVWWQTDEVVRPGPLAACGRDDTSPPPHKNALSPHNQIPTQFFSMKMTSLGENNLVICTINFDDIQLCLRQFCLKLNICKVMTIFFKFWPKKIRKTDFLEINYADY